MLLVVNSHEEHRAVIADRWFKSKGFAEIQTIRLHMCAMCVYGQWSNPTNVY
jgi:hypothetical protein